MTTSGIFLKNMASTVFVVLAMFGFIKSAAAFQIPERLEFELSYTGITAGHAVQEVRKDEKGIHIISTAKSADWLRFFFPVDDRLESFMTSGSATLPIGSPLLYQERKREGRTKTDREVRFDRKKMEVTTIDHRKKSEKLLAVTNRTYDTLSSFFYLRTMPLQVGSSYFIDIFDCKRLWNTEIKVLRREELVTPMGRFKTILVHPLLKSEGIFARTGDVFIWLTDDEYRIPVQMKSKVVVGSITATLVGGSYWPERKK